MEFAESWWAFVFPVAAYSISTVHLYLHHPAETWLLYYAGFLYALTWLFYATTTILSIYYGYQEIIHHRKPGELPPAARPLPEDIAAGRA
jgi:tellurite resistance protein TehA-like permease